MWNKWPDFIFTDKKPITCTHITYGVVFVQFHWLNQWYTEYLMYCFHCEETRRLVSILSKNIDAMFQKFEKNSKFSKDLKIFIRFQNFEKIKKISVFIKFKNFDI